MATKEQIIRLLFPVLFGMLGMVIMPATPAAASPFKIGAHVPIAYFGLEFSLMAFGFLWACDFYRWLFERLFSRRSAMKNHHAVRP